MQLVAKRVWDQHLVYGTFVFIQRVMKILAVILCFLVIILIQLAKDVSHSLVRIISNPLKLKSTAALSPALFKT